MIYTKKTRTWFRT